MKTLHDLVTELQYKYERRALIGANAIGEMLKIAREAEEELQKARDRIEYLEEYKAD